ncbi:hypothetical protein BC835DRAFT_537260 [Cytidiella melzeri]|nr:hypothetical protein BC835DRAFT_537260 [Cytidiella melzeri]
MRVKTVARLSMGAPPTWHLNLRHAVDNNLQPLIKEAKAKRTRTSTQKKSERLSGKRAGHRSTLIDMRRAKAAQERDVSDWSSDESDGHAAKRYKVSKAGAGSDMSSIEPGEILSDAESSEYTDTPDAEYRAGPSSRPTTDTTPEQSPIPSTAEADVPHPVRKTAVEHVREVSFEDKQVDEGVEVDMEDEEQRDEEDGSDGAQDSDDSDYEDDDSDGVSSSGTTDEELDSHDEQENEQAYLRLMPRPVLERMLQRLLKPPQSPQTRRAVESLIQECLPETVAAYDISVRIKINETYTAMVQEMQEQHSSLTSDDFADVMARFLRNEVKVLRSFPGSAPATFELILYIAEHSFGDLELDDRPGHGERTSFDNAADRALLHLAEERLEKEGATFRAAIPGYLETIRSQAMYLYRHGRHPRSWFPCTTAFLQTSLQTNSLKKCGRLRSDTRTASPFRLQRVVS